MRRIVALAFRMVMPAVVLLAQGSAPLQAADRNVVLLIADDFGIDVAGFYPTSARKPTTPPPPRRPTSRRWRGKASCSPGPGPTRGARRHGRRSSPGATGSAPGSAGRTPRTCRRFRSTSSACPRRSPPDPISATSWRASASGTSAAARTTPTCTAGLATPGRIPISANCRATSPGPRPSTGSRPPRPPTPRPTR